MNIYSVVKITKDDKGEIVKAGQMVLVTAKTAHKAIVAQSAKLKLAPNEEIVAAETSYRDVG